ncbi:low affinity immunoglobulin gamma Fc region receptor II-a-like isoform X2 [Echeneis naucrates]|uniref:low affinity immunoglobulin gamma Fc region receptor II-a-like isoform X2 n=1 Tax=Echeneis naucrates TaxID=173247 RepID=UPI001113F8B0|nr:low affinity immunoglobulin gamma Fc region receptor II-a-like isoform X2 [Echeneis naucrates]
MTLKTSTRCGETVTVKESTKWRNTDISRRMGIASVCLMLLTSCDSFFYSLAEPSTATLNIHPNKLQFFKYETIILTCHVPEDSTGWRVMRNTSIRVLQPCSEIWKSQHLSCSTEDTFPSDTGAYWCQSDRGERSNAIHIRVIDKGVILQSPSLPVMEGDPVTFLCLYKEKDQDTPTSNFQTSYFRNGAFIGRHSKGNMTLPSVSMSDEGLYKCEHPTKGQSAESKLTVSRRDRTPSSPPPSPSPHVVSLPRLLCSIVLISLNLLLLAVCVRVHIKWSKARAERERASSSL